LRRNLLANWEKSMKFMIGTKIFAGYTIAFLAIVTLSTVSYLSHQHLNASYLKGRSLRDLTDRIDQVHDFVSDGYQGQQIFLITGKGTGLTKLDETVAGLDQKIGGMRTVAGAEKYGTEIAKLEVAAKSLLNLLKTESATREAAALAGSVERAAGELEQFYLLSETFKMLVMREFNAVEQQTDLASGSLEHVILFGTPLALVFIGIIGLVVSRNITVALSRIEGVASRMAEGDFTATLQDTGRGDEIGSLARCFVAMNKALADLITQVQRSGLQVNSSAIEIAATTKQQQSTAGEVATTSAEISATAKEMSATSSELLKAADNVSTVAEQASELAADGKSGLVRMESIMHGILDASAAISAKLGVMNEKAGNITAVVTTIGKVADQTNLLSLNAAIEAEKAGEYGRGFAVVATEIRRLADQTAASTGDIEQMVREMVSAVSSGVMGMDKFGEELRRGATEISSVAAQLDQVISGVQSLAPSVESVNEGMRSQTLGAQHISEALTQLGEAARLTADSIRDSGRAIDNLNEATRGLQSGIGRFKLPG
jgi:methyl-accepting chemotaxis protein WspA